MEYLYFDFNTQSEHFRLSLLHSRHVAGAELLSVTARLPPRSRRPEYPLPSEALASRSFAPRLASWPWTLRRPIHRVVPRTSGQGVEGPYLRAH